MYWGILTIFIFVHVWQYLHTYVHVWQYMHTYIHAYIHTYIRACLAIRACISTHVYSSHVSWVVLNTHIHTQNVQLPSIAGDSEYTHAHSHMQLPSIAGGPKYTHARMHHAAPPVSRSNQQLQTAIRKYIHMHTQHTHTNVQLPLYRGVISNLKQLYPKIHTHTQRTHIHTHKCAAPPVSRSNQQLQTAIRWASRNFEVQGTPMNVQHCF
jgi:hypothetical protein